LPQLEWGKATKYPIQNAISASASEKVKNHHSWIEINFLIEEGVKGGRTVTREKGKEKRERKNPS